MMSLEECRAFYAQEIRFAASITTPGLVEAYGRVQREKFLGQAPWHIGSAEGRALSAAGFGQLSYTETSDVHDVYHNVVIALDRAKDINNGQPGSLARWIDALDLKPGDRVFHLGCGAGYYTAIMAEVVGGGGAVVGLELQPHLAERARQNLANYANVQIHCGEGAGFDPGKRDAMLINCGVTHPQTVWLERLGEGGRLVLPITAAMKATLGQGAMIKIAREILGYSAKLITPIAIFSGGNLRDPAQEPLVVKALTSGGLFRVKSVRRDAHESGANCVLHGADVCLSTAELAEVAGAA